MNPPATARAVRATASRAAAPRANARPQSRRLQTALDNSRSRHPSASIGQRAAPRPAPRTAPQTKPRTQPAGKPNLKLAPKSGPRFRKLYFISFLTGLIALVGLPFAIVILHASLVGGQRQLDDLRQDLNQQLELRQELLYERSQAVSPDRIRSVATEVLGMVEASNIIYLQSTGAETDGN